MNRPPLTKAEKNFRKRLRDRASRKLLVILRRYGHKCYWCSVPLIAIRQLAKYQIIKQTPNMVTWEANGTTFVRHWATVDHLEPLCDNPTRSANRDDNLVPSCHGCNKDRQNKGIRAYSPYVRQTVAAWAAGRLTMGRTQKY